VEKWVLVCWQRQGSCPRVLALPPPGQPSSARDTGAATAEFLAAGVGLVLFCGGDGTARDIAGLVGSRTPMLGIPAGVKMYSGVFGVSPLRSAEILVRFLKGELRPVEAEVLDLEEERCRSGEWIVRLHQTALTPFEPTFTQLAKQLIIETSEAEAKAEIARYVAKSRAARTTRCSSLARALPCKPWRRRSGFRKRGSASMPFSPASLSVAI
jgi:predicted polyphosphate/ATP-dependent NAD kinase